MSLTTKHVHTSGKTSNIPDSKTCTESFDATWYRRGYYSNQGFAAAIVYSKLQSGMLEVFPEVCTCFVVSDIDC